MGIDSKCQDLVTRDQQARFLVPLGHPPLASGIAIEFGKVGTKRLVFDGMQSCGCQQNKEGQEQGPFHGSYLVKWCIESIQSMKCQLQVTDRDWWLRIISARQQKLLVPDELEKTPSGR